MTTSHHNFSLHPQLAADSIELGQFELSRLLLINDSQYPWFVLVPQRPDIGEIYQLSATDQQQLLTESSTLAKHLAATFCADKLNIAALGNMVPQLHLHHIVRYRNDPAWPAPVWGHRPAQPYGETAIIDLIGKAKLDALPNFKAAS